MLKLNVGVFRVEANEFLRDNGIVKCSRIVEDLIEQGVDSDFTKDLKRLVESHELVESYGGLESAKKFVGSEYRKLSQPKTYNRLCEAISDVESCK